MMFANKEDINPEVIRKPKFNIPREKRFVCTSADDEDEKDIVRKYQVDAYIEALDILVRYSKDLSSGIKYREGEKVLYFPRLGNSMNIPDTSFPFTIQYYNITDGLLTCIWRTHRIMAITEEEIKSYSKYIDSVKIIQKKGIIINVKIKLD